LDTGKAVLRDFINATIGFAESDAVTDMSPKRRMRMLGPKGTALPTEAYVYAEWKECKVGLDYHVEIAKHYYSVSYRYLGYKL
jgi:transposase